MKFKTIVHIFLLFGIILLTACKSTSPAATPGSIEEAEKMLAKQQKQRAKQAKKEQKKAYKHFWSLQSKEAKKSIKKNKRRNKRLARAHKKGIY